MLRLKCALPSAAVKLLIIHLADRAGFILPQVVVIPYADGLNAGNTHADRMSRRGHREAVGHGTIRSRYPSRSLVQTCPRPQASFEEAINHKG